jgi:RNA methyltransferase, TrmH family
MEIKGFVKFVQSLQQKKNRIEKGMFVIEGDKMVRELMLSGVKTKFLAATGEWLKANHPVIPRQVECMQLKAEELKKTSSLSTPNQVIAIAEIPAAQL